MKAVSQNPLGRLSEAVVFPAAEHEWNSQSSNLGQNCGKC